jgi:hypothetical protein
MRGITGFTANRGVLMTNQARGTSTMRPRTNRLAARWWWIRRVAATLLVLLLLPAVTRAGTVAWLDDIVQQVVIEARTATRGDASAARKMGRLFAREANESLETAARRSDDLARAGRRINDASEELLRAKFARLLPHDTEAARKFAALAPAEKRLVVEMSETAQRLARRYPDQAETLIRKLGTDGLSAVRVYGDDVAEVLANEGPESLGVLRKTGRAGWNFFTTQVLPHKKKLLAAGVLAAFLANPDQFVDYAGKATEYAARQFASAGIHLAGVAAQGVESSVAEALAAHGLNFAPFRYLGMGLAGLVIAAAALVIVGLPISSLFRPLTWPLRVVLGRRKAARPT